MVSVDGVFEDGVFEDGLFEDGVFEDGVFEDGVSVAAVFVDAPPPPGGAPPPEEPPPEVPPPEDEPAPELALGSALPSGVDAWFVVLEPFPDPVQPKTPVQLPERGVRVGWSRHHCFAYWPQ